MNSKQMYDNLIARHQKTYGTYLMWWTLFGEDSKVKGTPFNTIPEALQLLRFALFDALIVNCNSLMEKRKDTSNIPNFIKNAAPDSEISNKLTDLSKKIFTLRSNCVAHYNSGKNHHDFFEDVELSPQDIEDFLEEIDKLLKSSNPNANHVSVGQSEKIKNQIDQLHEHLSTLK
jgi:hypothetical protein